MVSLLFRKQYVGKTQQSLRERHYGHRQDQAPSTVIILLSFCIFFIFGNLSFILKAIVYYQWFDG